MKKTCIYTKCGWITIALALIFLVTFFSIQKRTKELDERRVALIDVVGNNYIFRGNNPFVTKNHQKVFAYDELTSYFNNILAEEGLDPLEDYYLIDVSLLDLDHYYAIRKEQHFFMNHPQYNGKVLNFSTLSPSLLISENSSYSNFATDAVTQNYNLWITKLLERIYFTASHDADKPVVIYIHCDAGRDRTGLITAGYRMLFSNMSLEKARRQNIVEVGRNSRNLYDKAMHSYCLYVKENHNKPYDYCKED